eukprot:1177053-Prorocentrum_minimum.AAC.6
MPDQSDTGIAGIFHAAKRRRSDGVVKRRGALLGRSIREAHTSESWLPRRLTCIGQSEPSNPAPADIYPFPSHHWLTLQEVRQFIPIVRTNRRRSGQGTAETDEYFQARRAHMAHSPYESHQVKRNNDWGLPSGSASVAGGLLFEGLGPGAPVAHLVVFVSGSNFAPCVAQFFNLRRWWIQVHTECNTVTAPMVKGIYAIKSSLMWENRRGL